MLTGHTIGLRERSDSDELLLEDPVAEFDDAEAELSGKILYRASFDDLARSHVQCDTIIWVLISLLQVLAWGVGILLLVYLPVRRYVLQKEISSCKLYVISNEIVYKVTRPSFLPFMGSEKVEKRIPLHLVIGIIMEQGCLQSIYEIYTFRIENIARGKASPVDEFQFQGVSYPGLLQKIIIVEAAKSIREFSSWKPTPTRTRSLTEVSALTRLQSPGTKAASSSRSVSVAGGGLASDFLIHKLEEVKESVKKIESLLGQSKLGTVDSRAI